MQKACTADEDELLVLFFSYYLLKRQRGSHCVPQEMYKSSFLGFYTKLKKKNSQLQRMFSANRKLELSYYFL